MNELAAIIKSCFIHGCICMRNYRCSRFFAAIFSMVKNQTFIFAHMYERLCFTGKKIKTPAERRKKSERLILR